MPVWLILAIAFGIALVTLLPGTYLWWPARDDSSARVQLGNALVSGFVIAIAVLGLQSMVDWRLREIEDDRRRDEQLRNEQLTLERERQNLVVQLTLAKDLTGIDLRNERLEGFYLARKNFTDALLSGAHLERANLTGATMFYTELEGAHLEGAFLTRARMKGAFLTEAHLECADLREARLAGTDFTGAFLQGANLEGAKYLHPDFLGGVRCDAGTMWPKGITVRCRAKRLDCSAVSGP